MKQQSPHSAGSAATPGRRPGEFSNVDSVQAVREFVDRLELMFRLAAILDELELLPVDIDIPFTLAIGLYEDVAQELAPRRVA